MNKIKKTLLIFLAVCLVLGGFWVYWEQDVTLRSQLPEENWHYVTLVGIERYDHVGYTVDHVGYTVDEESSEKIIEVLNAAVVSRSFKEPRGSDFWIVLCPEGHKMVNILVGDNGEITINDIYGERYYEAGEELYEYLHQLAQSLPVTNPEDFE